MIEQKREALNTILMLVCNELQLSPTQKEKAEKMYEDLCNWIASSTNYDLKEADIFVQGSMATQTTVRPLTREEYDLDIVCLVHNRSLTPEELLSLVLKRIAEHSDYKKVLKPGEHRRNIGLEFPGEFHVDIVPAIPYNENAIRIPNYNKETGIYSWKETNPQGFKAWFDEKTKKMQFFNRKTAAVYDSFPEFKPLSQMKPLQNAVQLLKRWRDVNFTGTKITPPSSILISTISGNDYEGESDVFSAIKNIVKKMSDMAHFDMISITNPSLPSESLAKPMEDTDNFNTFVTKSKNLVTSLANLERAESIPDINAILENMFDENVTGRRVVKASISKYGHLVSHQKETGNITINNATGTISALGAFTSKINSGNSFHGN